MAAASTSPITAVATPRPDRHRATPRKVFAGLVQETGFGAAGRRYRSVHVSTRVPAAALHAVRIAIALALLVGVIAVQAVAGPAGPAGAAPNNYVTMPDGVQIAINVRLPDGYQAGRRYPTVFEMSGYDGGSADGGTAPQRLRSASDVPLLPSDDSRQLTDRFNTQYVTIHASVRGTGCSGGEFDLFSRKSAEDGKYIIDQWIAEQPWSNGDVASSATPTAASPGS